MPTQVASCANRAKVLPFVTRFSHKDLQDATPCASCLCDVVVTGNGVG
jgi:hypothetical protein